MIKKNKAHFENPHEKIYQKACEDLAFELLSYCSVYPKAPRHLDGPPSGGLFICFHLKISL